MLPLVISALCLFCFALLSSSLVSVSLCSVLLSGFIVPLLRLSTSTNCVFCIYSWLLAIRSKTVWFLFCLCRFTFCNYTWSSLLGVIMSVEGVATCPPLNGASLLRRFTSSVTSWMRYFSTVVVKRIQNPSKMWRIPSSTPLPPSGAISAVRSGASRSDAIRMFRAVDLLDQ